MYQDSFEKIS